MAAVAGAGMYITAADFEPLRVVPYLTEEKEKVMMMQGTIIDALRRSIAAADGKQEIMTVREAFKRAGYKPSHISQEYGIGNHPCVKRITWSTENPGGTISAYGPYEQKYGIVDRDSFFRVLQHRWPRGVSLVHKPGAHDQYLPPYRGAGAELMQNANIRSVKYEMDGARIGVNVYWMSTDDTRMMDAPLRRLWPGTPSVVAAVAAWEPSLSSSSGVRVRSTARIIAVAGATKRRGRGAAAAEPLTFAQLHPKPMSMAAAFDLAQLGHNKKKKKKPAAAAAVANQRKRKRKD